MPPCLILVGMMGSGKSALGRLVAEKLGRTFKDTDQLISDRLCQPIPLFFQRYGEPAFREHESSVLRDLVQDGSVIATGGGVVLREQNWTELRRLGPVVYLRVRPEVLEARLSESRRKRPLLQNDRWQDTLRELLITREPLYQKADICVDLGGETLDEAADKVVRAIAAQTQGAQ